jgi:hypothetical protein
MISLKRHPVLSFLIFFSIYPHSMNASTYTLKINIPDSLNGWTVKETLQIGTKEALYDYIDGGAEQFISYGYINAVSKTYEKTGEPDVRIELFDMNNSKNAYGIFSNFRYDENDAYGQGSQYIKGALFFWKGRYFINITAIEETGASERFIGELANHIINLIAEPGEKPEILNVLPEQELDCNGILYFHHYIWLNAYYFISNDNILFIDDETDAVSAKYGSPDDRHFLLIVKYKNIADSEKAFDNFVKEYFTGETDEDICIVEDNKWMAFKKQDDFIIAVFNGNSENQVRELLQKTLENIKKLNKIT